MSAALILASRVIVNDLREQARSYKGSQFFQGHVQRQHVHHRWAHQWAFDVLVHQTLQRRHRQVTCSSHPSQLIGNRLWWQVWIKTAAGGSQQCHRHRSLVWHQQFLGIVKYTSGQRWVAWAEVAGAAGNRSKRTGRWSRVEPAVTGEILGDQAGTTNLAA